MKPDDDFVRRIGERNEEAFVELIEKYDRILRQAIIWWLTRNGRMSVAAAEVEAGDLVQEVYFDLVLKGIRPITSTLAGYLIGAARHKASNRLRKKIPTDAADPVEADVFVDARPNPEQQFYLQELSDALRERISKMPILSQQILNLYIQGYSIKEIADLLGIRPSDVKSRLYRGRGDL